MDELIEKQFELIKRILEPLIRNKQAKDKLLRETHIRQEEIKNFTEKIAATKISQAYKSFKSYKSIMLRKNEAATSIAQAYKSKLGLVEANKRIANVLCEINSTQDVYRKKIDDLLISHGTPKKLSNLYFYFCKFGNKKLGYSTKTKLPSIITEIVGCVFVNTSFASTNFDSITFKQSKFINVGRNNPILQRSSPYKTTKTKYNIATDSFIFENVSLIESRFLDCEFHNIHFASNSFFDSTKVQINNILPTFKNCNFNGGSIFHDRSFGPAYKYVTPPPSKYNMKYYTLFDLDKLVASDKHLMIKPDGSLMTPLEETSHPAEIVFEDCKFTKTSINYDKLNMPGNRNIMFSNCVFNGNMFVKEKFNCYHFKKCSFNNVSFIECAFAYSYFEECTFKDVLFHSVTFTKGGALRFTKCKLYDCNFNNVVFNQIGYKNTLVFDSNNIINKCTFRSCLLFNFKFNNDSLYNIRDTKLLDMKKSEFINCSLYGVNFNNCDLEGSKFGARIDGVGNSLFNRVNWFGHIFLVFDYIPFPYGEDKTREFEVVCNLNNPDGFNLYVKEFKGHKLATKKQASRMTDYFALMQYDDYVALNIDVRDLKNPEYNINPYDYFRITDDTTQQILHIYIVPETYMFNTNIKNCNFQQVDGFDSFNFTQVKQNAEGKPDLTAANFTVVNLLNANFNGCKIVGAVFDVADVAGVDFRNSIVNENTSFENTMNTDQVLGQLQKDDGSIYIEGTLNLSTGREFQFSEIQQRANETHARIANIIDNKEKLFAALETIGIPTDDDNFKEAMEEFLITSHGGRREYVDYVVIRGTSETIVGFLDHLIVIYKKIISTQRNLPDNEDKDYIKDNFASALTNYLAYKLKLDRPEKGVLLESLVRALSDDFVKYLVMYKPHLNGNWCFLQLVVQSLKLLVSCTDLYIYNFMEYYFNEIFNAHGQGSQSCPLGMVERWITIHSQVLETYLMLLRKSDTELQELDTSAINKLKSYSRNNTRDPKITKAYIYEFNNSESVEKLHNKYIFHKLINILKPHSKLPENLESDIGYDLDYNISIEMSKECNRLIKSKLDDGSVTTLQQIYEAYIEIMCKLIIANNKITQEHIDKLEADTRPVVKRVYTEKRDALYTKIREEEAKNYIIVLCMAVELRFDEKSLDFENLANAEEKLTMKELVEYYDATTTGGKRRNARNTRKERGLSPKSPKSPKLSVSPKSPKLSVSPKSPKSPKLYNMIEEIIINKLKALSIKEFTNINIMSLDEANIVFNTNITSKSLTRKRADSNPIPKTSKRGKTLSKRSKSLESLMKSNDAFSYNVNAIYSFINFKNMNMNIQNKFYINIVRQRHNKICETHKKILDMTELNSRIKLKEKVISKPKRLTGTLKKKPLNKSTSPTNIMAF